MLYEFQEDIIFLYFGLTADEMPALHQKYLAAFYEEEFDNQESAIDSTQKRPMIRRKKIRAYLANKIEGTDIDPSSSVELFRTNSKAYSGFVHGASPQIMAMCAGDPPRFHVSGMLGTPQGEEHCADLCNYFYRGLLSFAYVALAFGNETLFSEIRKCLNEFAKRAGMDFGDPEPRKKQ